MPSRIDHVIIAAPDLTLLEESFARLGFSVVGGGTHPHLGTRNRIVVLGDGYIELLAIGDAAKASPTLRDRIARGAGWVGYALQSGDIAAEAQAMRQRGVDARGPTAGRLIAPDGATRSWQVVTIGSDDLWAAAFPLPFLIQHDSTGERHRRELAGADALAPHANGATNLIGVTLRASNIVDLRRSFEHAYGLTSVLVPYSEYTGAVTYHLIKGESIWLCKQRQFTAQDSHVSAQDTTMSVHVGAPDLARMLQAIKQTKFATTLESDGTHVTLPTINAEIVFSITRH